MSSAQIVKPAALRPGDRIGIAAPASAFDRAAFEAGCAALRQMGYQPVFCDSIFDRDLYFAGSGERRARELNAMFASDDLRAIICARGGYGTNYLLPHLDLDAIRRSPKIFIGCSDVTALLTWIHDQTGLITFHGPMAAGDFARATVCLDQFRAVIGESARSELIVPTAVPITPGTATGKLYGGCLSILVASLGTPYEINTDGAILFLEDIGEPAYRLDRMLMQLKLAGKLRHVRGIIFGEMHNCTAPSGHTLPEILARVLADVDVPIAYGIPSGHVSRGSLTLPIGVQAELRVGEQVTLAFEAAVRD